MEKRNQRAIGYNMLSQVLVQAVVFIAGLLVPRYILLYYGSEVNGVATTVNQIISYASILEAGLGMASIHALYKPLATDNIEEINGICVATKNFYYKVTVWMAAALFAASFVYSFLAKGATSKTTIFLIVISISSTTLIEHAFHAKYRVLLTADQKLYVVSFARIAGIVIQTVIKIALIFARVHIALVYAASSLALILRIIFLAFYVKKKYPTVSFSGKANLSAIKQRSALVAHQIAGLVVNNSGAIIVSLTSKEGLKLASVYAVYRLVYKNMYTLVTGAFSNGSVASFGRLLASNKLEDAKRAFRTFEILYYSAIGVIYGSIASLILPFVGLYTKGVSDAEYVLPVLALMMTVEEMLNCTRVPGGMLINASGHFQQTKNRAILEAVINFVVTLLLIGKYDIYAVVIAGIVSYIYRVTDIIIYENRKILKDSPWTSVRSILIAWGGAIISWGILRNIIPPLQSWPQFFGYGLLSVGVSCVAVGLWAFVLRPKQVLGILKRK